MNRNYSIFISMIIVTILFFSTILSSRLIYGDTNMPPPVQGPAVDCTQDPSACQNPTPAPPVDCNLDPNNPACPGANNNPPPATNNNPPSGTTDTNPLYRSL